jgi:glycine/D-amino acid oxidase-like deaminating enzyme
MAVSQIKNNLILFDFIIVGQGLAGSVLAISLIKAGFKVCVIDEPKLSLSSKVAAGIWNPVVFKRLTNSWLADELVPELMDFYTWFEQETNSGMIQNRHIIKPFTEEQEKNLWLKKAQTDNEFLDKQTYENLFITTQQSITSYSKVLNAGNLDVISFLYCAKNYIEHNGMFIEEQFDFDQLKNADSTIHYQSVSSKNIIFCEGHLITQNPFFNWIPMKPAKGEILTIHCEELLLEKDILNKGIFILPLGNHTYKVGATYEWENLDDTPTEKRKIELQQKLDMVIQTPYAIIKHEAGVRPSVTDRRPVIGCHPELNNYFVFNGFGTKAVMLAPYFAKQFVEHIKHFSPIHPEVDTQRFYKK